MLHLSIRPAPETELVPVDVALDVQPDATVHDLADALAAHLAPDRTRLLLAPTRDGRPWPASQRLADCRLRTGDVLDVTAVPASWANAPGRPLRDRALVRVIAGPDAGREIPVTGDAVTIGRGASNTVELHDPLVSRRHARVLLDPAPMVVDEGSAHGTTVDGAPVRRATPVEWGRPIGVGGSVVELHRSGDAAVSTDRGVVRPPRFGERLRDDEVEIPAPPSPTKPPPMPWTTLAMPLVLGLAMLSMMRSPYVLVYLAGWPLLTFFGHREQKRRARREFEEELAIWRQDVDVAMAELDRHNAAQAARAATDHPDPAGLRDRVVGRDALLWARRAGDDDFLAVRGGLGPVLARLRATVADGGDREVTAGVRAEVAERAVIADLPVLVPVATSRLIAVAGDDDVVDAAARALVARLCVDHSPADLTVAAVLGRRREGFETWLRWLPHVARRVGGVEAVAFGPAEGQRLLERLADEDGGTGVTVCLVDERAGVPRRTVEAVAAVAPDRRLHLVWLGREPDRVPAATDALYDLTASVPQELSPPVPCEAVVAHRDRGGVEPVTAVDRLSLAEAWQLARSLSGCSDEAAVLPADTALPEQVRLPALTADLTDPDDAAAIVERWASSRGLKAVVGAGVDGAVALDLREDGPHGLVAGTTGSGKSELLQTLICSLALHNPPSRMTFLLVDYKGGAAFRECADLPHTVGYITDLSPALVQRALTSLSAEITAREHLLDAYGAKDLQQLEREHPEVAPPSVLICVDEFAALTTEVPEFVDGVVNIAQRGRSLGMHLLLATQRPAGVVTANIKANTDLRIALRVGAADDSQDVIESSDAAHISRRTPGRAWIRRTGHGTAELVQTAWVGAREQLMGSRAAVEVQPFTARRLPDRAGTEQALGLHERTDLERLVTTVRDAFDLAGHAPPSRPWRPPLAPALRLEVHDGVPTLDAGDTGDDAGEHDGTFVAASGPAQVPIGRLDDPQQRRQPPLVLDYAQAGHVLVYGASGAGKTELLRTVAVASGLASPDLPPHVYALDFAGGGLTSLEGWSTVGSVIGEQQLERAMRLLRMLDRTVTDRGRLLASAGAADLDELAAAGHPLPRVHVLVDNLIAFVDALEGGGSLRRQHAELLTAVLQNGRRVGVHVTATAPTRVGLPSGLLASFGTRLVLRMTVEDDYAMLGVPLDVLDAESPAGRGLLGRTELQVATTATDGDLHRLEALATPLRDAVGDQPPTPILSMPSRVPETALPAPEVDVVPIGVDADAVSVVRVPLRGSRLLIAGRGGSGRTSALLGLAAAARRSDVPPAEVALVGPGTAAHAGAADVVLDDPAALPGLVERWRAAAGDDAWRLLLIDDLHVWERLADADPALRQALDALVALAEDAPAVRAGVVVATDLDDARSRQHAPGVLQVVKRSRQGVLLQPDGMDGGVLGVTLPLQTLEPLTGPGRGLWCADGDVRVIHLLAVTTVDEHVQ